MFIKQLFKYYPSKAEKPHVTTILVGTLYDFGLIWIAIVALQFYFIEVPDDPVIGGANRELLYLVPIDNINIYENPIMAPIEGYSRVRYEAP